MSKPHSFLTIASTVSLLLTANAYAADRTSSQPTSLIAKITQHNVRPANAVVAYGYGYGRGWRYWSTRYYER